MFERIAPTFPVSDVAAALDFYGRLGWDVRRYAGEDEYGFASREGVEIHLGGVADRDHRPATAYLYGCVSSQTTSAVDRGRAIASVSR